MYVACVFAGEMASRLIRFVRCDRSFVQFYSLGGWFTLKRRQGNANARIYGHFISGGFNGSYECLKK